MVFSSGTVDNRWQRSGVLLIFKDDIKPDVHY